MSVAPAGQQHAPPELPAGTPSSTATVVMPSSPCTSLVGSGSPLRGSWMPTGRTEGSTSSGSLQASRQAGRQTEGQAERTL